MNYKKFTVDLKKRNNKKYNPIPLAGVSSTISFFYARVIQNWELNILIH